MPSRIDARYSKLRKLVKRHALKVTSVMIRPLRRQMRLELVEDVFGDGTLPQLRGNAPGLFKGRNRLHIGQGAFPACLFIGGKIQMHREHAIARRVRLARRLHIAVVIVPRGIPFMILVGDVRFVVVWSEHTPPPLRSFEHCPPQTPGNGQMFWRTVSFFT